VDFYLQDTIQHDVINTLPLPDNEKCRKYVWRRYTIQSMQILRDPPLDSVCDAPADPTLDTVCDAPADPTLDTVYDALADPTLDTVYDALADPTLDTVCDAPADPTLDTVDRKSVV
jgi:hypothetical protein